MGTKLIGSVGLASSGVPDDLLTTKGDTHGFSSTNARIPISTNNFSLLCASAESLGLKWGASATSVLGTTGDILSCSSANVLSAISPSTSGHVLTSNGSTTLPSFQAVSASTLTKVTKSYTDISDTEMAIYTLPAEQALVNVFTDITTAFDVSTAVTIGDSADENGFQQSADWTSTGLTDVTRGTYVTTFKTMRSTSGTTEIKAYGLAGTSTWTATGTGSGNFGQGYFSGNPHTSGIIIDAGNAVIGNVINYVDFSFNADSQGSVSTDFVVKIFDSSDVEKATVSVTATINDASTTVRFTFTGNAYVTVAGDYIQVDNNGGNYIEFEAFTGTTDDYSGFRTPDPTSYFPHCAVNYGAGDTQGAVDFYLQIAS